MGGGVRAAAAVAVTSPYTALVPLVGAVTALLVGVNISFPELFFGGGGGEPGRLACLLTGGGEGVRAARGGGLMFCSSLTWRRRSRPLRTPSRSVRAHPRGGGYGPIPAETTRHGTKSYCVTLSPLRCPRREPCTVALSISRGLPTSGPLIGYSMMMNVREWPGDIHNKDAKSGESERECGNNTRSATGCDFRNSLRCHGFATPGFSKRTALLAAKKQPDLEPD